MTSIANGLASRYTDMHIPTVLSTLLPAEFRACAVYFGDLSNIYSPDQLMTLGYLTMVSQYELDFIILNPKI